MEGVRKEHGWFGRRARGRAKVVHLEDLGSNWESESLAEPQGPQTFGRWNGRPMAGTPIEADDTLYATLVKAVECLPERQRRVIELHYFEGKRLCDAAEEMRVGRPWVSRLHDQAIDRLRVELGKGIVVPLASRASTGSESPAVGRREDSHRRDGRPRPPLVGQSRK